MRYYALGDVNHPPFVTETMFSHHLLLAVSSHWFRGRERESDMIGCSVCFPPFVAMGDTFLLLMQYQHCHNCLWCPPPDISYSIILAPALSLCFKVSFIDSLHFFVSTPLAHTSVYI